MLLFRVGCGLGTGAGQDAGPHGGVSLRVRSAYLLAGARLHVWTWGSDQGRCGSGMLIFDGFWAECKANLVYARVWTDTCTRTHCGAGYK